MRLILFQILDPPLTSTVQTNMATAKHTWLWLHRALCNLFQPDTDGTLVSKCRLLSQETRGLDPILFQYWSRAVGGGANIETALGQILVFAGLHTGVCLHPPLPSIIFSPADQGSLLLARQPANHKLTTILEIESGGHHPSANFTMRSSSVYGGQCRLWLSSL